MADEGAAWPQEFGTDTVYKLLPHRQPFLLVDRVSEWEANKRIVAHKCVSANEPHFPGHFPGHPVMPGVLIIEALAQAAGLLVRLSEDGEAPPMMYLAGIDKARIKRMVLPGDTLRLEVEVLQVRAAFARLSGVASTADGLAASCELLSAFKS